MSDARLLMPSVNKGHRPRMCSPRDAGRNRIPWCVKPSTPPFEESDANITKVEHRMSIEEFRLLRDLIYEYCGIYFQDDSMFLVQRRLTSRLETLSMANFTEYYRYLRSGRGERRRDEIEEVVERITTNET